jgi:hypothetical protein
MTVYGDTDEAGATAERLVEERRKGISESVANRGALGD